jgi:beta-N-acetylhexosaminidase
MQSTKVIMGRVIISLSGTKLLEEEKQLIAHPYVCGVILFARNHRGFDNELLLELIADIQKAAIAARKNGMPIFADQEGGFVQRVGRGLKPLPANYVHGLNYDINSDSGIVLAKGIGNLMAIELGQFGIISLSPVLDLQLGNTVIEGLGRAFHKDPEVCYILANAYIEGMQEAGMQATGKHFPGHGLNIGDSHISAPVDIRSLDELESKDLLPFIKLIKENKLAAIMPSHITYSAVDPNNIAGMSSIWINDLLRSKYEFNGITISDCLAMAGAGAESDLDKVKKSLQYLDVALLCNKTVEQYLEILNQLDESHYMNERQQRAFKHWMGNSTSVRLSIYNKFHAESNNMLTAYEQSTTATSATDQDYRVTDEQQSSGAKKLVVT